ncbi:MAG: hypothetical protein LV473_23080, partial [Nitrospira sp.]|nr:hypothetical protein [Nitrospira sp.]
MFVGQAMIGGGDYHNSGDSIAEFEERRVFPFTILVGLINHPCNNADRFRVNTCGKDTTSRLSKSHRQEVCKWVSGGGPFGLIVSVALH